MNSTHSYERNLLTALVATNTRSLRVEHRLAVHEKSIKVMTVAQQNLNAPPAIYLPVHGNRNPLIEIASDLNEFRAGSIAIEVDRPQGIVSRI
jgi:hypothetical protein